MVQAAGATHVGYIRERNEDAFLVAPDRQLFAVADGLGGHPAGDVASRLTIDAIARHQPADDREDWIRGAVEAAHAVVTSAARRNPDQAGMGTTLVIAIVDPDHTVWIGNIGDSRAYLFVDGSLKQVTEDHSDATVFGKGAITQTIGAPGPPNPDVYRLAAGPGDRLLLCTDGISDYVPSVTMLAALASSESPQAACDALVNAALDAGGKDNATAVVIDF